MTTFQENRINHNSSFSMALSLFGYILSKMYNKHFAMRQDVKVQYDWQAGGMY